MCAFVCVCRGAARRRRHTAQRIPPPIHAPHARPLAKRHVDVIKQAGQHALLTVAGRKLVACSSRDKGM